MLSSKVEMVRSKQIFLLLVLVVMAVPALNALGRDNNSIFIHPVNPGEIRAGEILTVTGRALDSAHIREIYLNDGHTDFQVEILGQESGTMRLRVPTSTPAGQMRFGIVRANRHDVVDQPVFLKVLPALGLV